MRPGENAFSLGSSCFSAIFVFTDAGIFQIWQTFPAMHIQKKKTGNTEAAVQPVFIVCAARAGYVCSEDQQAGPLAASVGRIRWLQEKILPSTDFFGSIYTGQNELRKNDGVTPVCFWKVAEKWLLS